MAAIVGSSNVPLDMETMRQVRPRARLSAAAHRRPRPLLDAFCADEFVCAVVMILCVGIAAYMEITPCITVTSI